MPNNNNDKLDSRAAADYLDIDVRTLESWRYRGIGPKFLRYSSRSVRYLRADLDQFIAASSVEPRPRRLSNP